MKRFIVLVLVALVVTALPLVAACGEKEESTTTSAVSTTAGQSTTTTGGATTSEAQTTTTAGKPVTLYVGGTFALTGAYAEDCAAVLAGFKDYIAWVNDNHIVAPWHQDRTIPANIKFELLWADDALAPDKTLSIYEEFKAKGMLVQRVSGSPEGMALKDLLVEDNIGATSQSTSAAYLTPPGNIFLNAPVYTDEMAAIAEWFLESWTESRKPRIAYLTADAALGRSIDIPELKAYLEKLGYEFVGAQFVDLVPKAPPTTQLAWLKDKGVDLAVGVMVNPGSQPTIKEAVRLGMGTNQPYKITFGFGNPGHLQIFLPAMKELAEGVVVAGDFCAEDAQVPGIEFANMLKEKYGAGKNANCMYLDGIVEAMTQVEALRLAAMQVDPSKLTPEDVLKKGFWQIKDLDTGGIFISPFTYGEGDVMGPDVCRIQQVQNGKIVDVGSYPMRYILPTKQ
ncbi:MAG: ABC transporter substrate-binding protein [Thermoleophilia bacterium]|nr:ABC transporter substrate-binding protein [Thermoleophilia bacterium]